MYKIRACLIAFVIAVVFAVPASADWFTFEFECEDGGKARTQVEIPNQKDGAKMAAAAEKAMPAPAGCKTVKRYRTKDKSDAEVVNH